MKIPLQQYWQLLHAYLRPQWVAVLLLAVLLLSHIGLQLLNPQIMRFFIDTAVAAGPLSTLINAALLFLGIALVNQALSIINTYLGERIAWTATNALRLDLLLHCLRLDQSFHKTHTAGALLERIDGDVNTLSNFFSRFTIQLVGNGLLMVGVLLLLFLEDWRVGGTLSLFTVISLVVLARMRTLATPYWVKVRAASADFYGFLGEQLAGLEDVRGNGATGYVLRQFDKLMQRWFPLQRTANMLGSLLWTTNVILFGVATVLVFGLSAYLWRTGTITIGTAYLLFHYTELLRRPLGQLRNELEDLQQAEAGIRRIGALFTTQSRLPDMGQKQLPDGPLAVQFSDVGFGYEADAVVLDGINFLLPPGRVLGLLGRTGSGKTTLARLLLRLYDPQNGRITLGGLAPSDIPLAQLRQRVGMVTQDVQLFQASIRDNLTFFDDSIEDGVLTAVLHDIGLRSWLQSQTAGLNTVLVGGHSHLSAGQAQLLALARLFLTDPGLVILDEASSRLDPATEQLLERAIDRLLAHRTGIIIAHRLQTVQRADDILILENGRVVEYGVRQQLAQDTTSHFYHLLQTGIEEVLV